MSAAAPARAGSRRRVASPRRNRISTVARLRSRWQQATAESAGRPAVTVGNLRGAMWIGFIAVEYYLLSNPLVFVPGFESSLGQALGLALIVVLCHAKHLRPPAVSWPVVALLVLAALSMLWGISADDTWAALRVYTLIAVVAGVIASNASTRVIAYGFALGGVIIVLASLYAHAKHLPGADVPLGTIGYMAGVGTNRNILAYSLVPALGACLATWPRAWHEWLTLPAFAAINALGLYLAESGTGYLAVLVVVATAGALRIGLLIRPYVGRRAIVAAMLAALAVLVAVVVFFDRIGTALGRDSGTLSGRVPLWESVIHDLNGNIVAGLGWGAVWPHPWQIADANAFTTDLATDLGVLYAHGHNSFIDVLAQLGLLGVAVVVWCYLDLIGRSAHRMWSRFRDRDVTEAGLFILVTAAGHLAFGMTEPMAVIPLGWFILVVIACLAAAPRGDSTAPAAAQTLAGAPATQVTREAG